MPTAPQILLAPASGAGIGGGHVMRLLALAQALKRRGADCAFICGAQGAQLVARYGEGLFPAHSLDRPLDVEAIHALSPAAFDAVVIDDYQAGADLEAALRSRAGAVMVIDDLADRAHACDILIDPGYGRREADYAGLVPPAARVLTGPAYALLRPEFGARRSAALARGLQRPLRRLFMSFGLSDVGAVAARVYDALAPELADIEIDLAIAGDAASLGPLRQQAARRANLRLHVDATDVAGLMAGADAAIGAGGASTWERACLALPTLAVVVADNQREMIERLTHDQILLSADMQAPDFEASISHAFAQLRDPAVRAGLAKTASGLCDGAGADRAAQALLDRQ